jgi:molybdopterin-guanine dinucleotide biosynthesis protein A
VKSAVILAGGFSRRFGSDKGLVLLMNKPLVRHVIDKVSTIVDEVIVVVSREEQKNKFVPIVENGAKLIIDEDDSQSPLIGTITGLEKATSKYSLILPCDVPLVSTQILQYLFELRRNRHAVIPRWPNGYIEPLQAIYHTKSALSAAKTALNQGFMNMRSMIENMTAVRYLSTLALKQLDPNLWTFFNINNQKDLLKAESYLKKAIHI